jgi:hypothetical protein
MGIREQLTDTCNYPRDTREPPAQPALRTGTRKSMPGAVPTIMTGMANPMGGLNSKDTAGLAVAAQSLTMVMTSNENTRIREREEDKGSKSLIRNLGPTQPSLFTRLASEHMWEPPEMSAFMKLVLHEKIPAKATQLIVAQMRKWKGTSASGSPTPLHVQWLPLSGSEPVLARGHGRIHVLPSIGDSVRSRSYQP